jgi:hypothetical protein
MGPGFALFGWLILILASELLLSPLTIIGAFKFLKTRKKLWLTLVVPAAIPLVVPPFLIISAILGFLLSGDFGPIKRPIESEVIGYYIIDSESKEYLMERKKYLNLPDTIAMEFKEGGILIWINQPDCVQNISGESNGVFKNQKEDWKIAESNILDSFITGWPINNGNLNITQKDNKYRIKVGIGDPDSGDWLTFEKDKI